MATGIFGSIRGANLDISRDVDMFYYYRPTRSTEDDNFRYFKPLNASECLIKVKNDEEKEIIGAFNLRLPLDKFNAKGFYTIYIMPKELSVSIIDVSVLAAYPDVKGIVLTLSGDLAGITDLTGYRIEYPDGSIRLVTSCSNCEPVVVNIGDSYPKTTRYKLTDGSSNLVFCTLTPSSTLSFKPDASPYIGKAEEEVKIYNTLFSPKMLEIEMVDHDIDTVSTMLEGDQVRDRDHGIITTYTPDKLIYIQNNVYTIKSKNGVPLYDVKTKRENIDSSQDYDTVIG